MANQVRNHVQPTMRNKNCWICEQWVETEFEVNILESGNQDAISAYEKGEATTEAMKYAYIHFDFDDYQPDRMLDIRAEAPGKFKVYRMVPQGRYHYFFSFQGHSFLDTETAPIVQISQMTQSSIEKRLTAIKNKYDYYVTKFELQGLNHVDTVEILKSKLLEMEEAEK